MPLRRKPAAKYSAKPVAKTGGAGIHHALLPASESVVKVSIIAEFIEGKSVFVASAASVSSGKLIKGPARLTQDKAAADCDTVQQLAQYPESDSIALKWRNDQCDKRKLAQFLKAGKRAMQQAAKQRRKETVAGQVLKRSVVSNAEGPPLLRVRLRGKQPLQDMHFRRLQEAVSIHREPEMQETDATSPRRNEAARLSLQLMQQVACESKGPPTGREQASSASSIRREDSPKRTYAENTREVKPTGSIVAVSTQSASSSQQAPQVANCHALQTAKQKIQDTFAKRVAELPDDFRHFAWQSHCVELAADIISEFQKQLPNPWAQVRTLIFNLKDARNPDFIKDVLSLEVLPSQLPLLSTEEMASAASRAARSARHEQLAQASVLNRGVSGALDRAALAQFRAFKAK